MRVWNVSCKDNQSAKEIVLSEVGYDEAISWLREMLSEHGKKECGMHYDHGARITTFYTGRWKGGMLDFGRKYYYDAERNMLLAD